MTYRPLVLAGALAGGLLAAACSSSPSANSGSTTTTAALESGPATSLPIPSTTAPKGPATTFGDGTYLVGTDIAPGTYRTKGGNFCYWERQSGTGGQLTDIISNDTASGPAIVTIAPTDKAFKSSGCGEWSPLPASGPQATSFGEGTFAVGIDIAPGTYKAPGGTGCYWERESEFGGSSVDSVIANDNPTGPVVVTIAPTDKGFKSHGCGKWTAQ